MTRLQHSQDRPVNEKVEFMHDNELWGFLCVLAGKDPTQELTPSLESNLGTTYRVAEISVPADRVKHLRPKE